MEKAKEERGKEEEEGGVGKLRAGVLVPRRGRQLERSVRNSSLANIPRQEMEVELEVNSIFHVSSLEKSNKERKIKRMHSKWPVAGNRSYTEICFGKAKNTAVRALYDTGASVTIVPVEVYRLARKAKAVGQEVPNHGVSLKNASGEPMPIQGVYWMHMTIAGRKMIEPVVVGRNVTSAIIGQNIIEGHGLCFNPANRQFFYVQQEEPMEDWEVATVEVAQERQLGKGQSSLVSCSLRNKESGEKLRPFTTFVASIEGATVIGKTDGLAMASIYLRNSSEEDRSVREGQVIGDAEPISHYEKLDGKCHCGEHAQIDEVGLSRGLSKGKKLAGKKKVSHQVRKMIDETIRRCNIPRKLKSRYRELLLNNADIISKEPADLGHSTTVVHDIKLRSDEPVFTKQFTLPKEEWEVVKSIASPYRK